MCQNYFFLLFILRQVNMLMLLLIIIVSVIAVLFWINKEGNEPLKDLKGRTVFITGCDTGFGHELALRLDKRGLKVFAGCLTSKGVKELKDKTSPQLEAFICDITKEDDIRNAESIVKCNSPDGLWALVNNAGVGAGGEWDWLPERFIRSVMEVNFFGHVAVTRAFLPLLKKRKGRIVNLTSMLGTFSIPSAGIYCCSKYAMEAFNDTLRLEMRKWGVSVYAIEPGFAATGIVHDFGSIMEKIWREVDEDKKREAKFDYFKRYGAEYEKSILVNLTPPVVDPVHLIVDVLQSKIISKYPTFRTRVGRIANKGYWINTLLPTSWVDRFYPIDNNHPLPAALIQNNKK